MLQALARSSQLMIIGYGNTLRRDDGAGVALAEQIAATWQTTGQPVQLITSPQIVAEMAASIAEDDVLAVIFVDTTTDLDAKRIQVEAVAIDSTTASTGHQLAPPTLLTYAALLYNRFPRAWLVTIPGVDFRHGEGFSPQVTHLLNDVTPIAVSLLASMKEAIPCMN